MARPRSLGSFVSENGYVLDDLDRAILAALPDEGAKQGKYLPLAPTPKQLRAQVDTYPNVYQYVSRLKLLLADGYVVRMRTSSRGYGWQRTAKGKLAASAES